MAHGKSRKLNRGGPCVQCGATQSTLFRRSPEGTMCNPCGLRHKRQQQRQQRESVEGVGEGSSEQLSAERCASEDTAQLLVENKPANASDALISSEENKVCSVCATDSSPLWRSVDGNLACNKCALRARRKGKRQSDTQAEDLSEEMHTVPPTPKRRASSQVWHQGLTGEPAPPAIDSYVRELANCGHVTEADMRMYLCLWTELNEEQRRMAREAVTAARDEGDVAGGADHVRLVVSHNEMQYGRPALMNMVNELMGPFDDGCRGGTTTGSNATNAGNGQGGLIMA